MDTYTVYRFFQNGDREVVETGLFLDEAKAHCKDAEASSRTSTSDEAVARTEEHGPWFDGYEQE